MTDGPAEYGGEFYTNRPPWDQPNSNVLDTCKCRHGRYEHTAAGCHHLIASYSSIYTSARAFCSCALFVNREPDSLARVVAVLDEYELEFLRDEFVLAGESVGTWGDDEAFDCADDIQDELEIRQHGHIVTGRTPDE